MKEAYGEPSSLIMTCKIWFQSFDSDDFHVKDSEHFGRLQICEEELLQKLLDDDPTQSQHQLVEEIGLSEKQTAGYYEK